MRMRILGVPILYHYVQYRCYFYFKVVLPIVNWTMSRNPPKFIEKYLIAITFWGIDVVVKTIQWKLNKEGLTK